MLRQQATHRQIHPLAGQVPQRQLGGGDRLCHRAVAADPLRSLVHSAPQASHVRRVGTQQDAAEPLCANMCEWGVHGGAQDERAAMRLAPAFAAVLRRDPQQEAVLRPCARHIGRTLEEERVNRGDPAHAVPNQRCSTAAEKPSTWRAAITAFTAATSSRLFLGNTIARLPPA